jgi:hypothetical protein
MTFYSFFSGQFQRSGTGGHLDRGNGGRRSISASRGGARQSRSPILSVLRIRIRIRIHRIRKFLGLLDPDPDPLVRGMDPDPDPSIIKQK